LAKDAPQVDQDFTTFLAQAYKYKEIGDYGVGPAAVITMPVADDAIKTASNLIENIAELLASSANG
jgi:hypothetical protein